MTPGFALPARHVVHTVGPIWRGGGHGEPDLLAACYRESLRCAAAIRARSVAFPCISTGVYGYPARAAARIALASVQRELASCATIERVLFCCFGSADLAIYRELLGASN